MRLDNRFSDEVVAAIVKHMNGDHGSDSLLICQQFGTPTATDASMTDFDQLGADFETTVDGRATRLRVPWRGRITERAEVRAEVVWLFEEATRRSGSAGFE
ncbi:MAG: DUF2470 domain-containing protein [Microthrixaceae bacterium]